VEEQEAIVGRSKPDSARLEKLAKSSHVARSRTDKDESIPIVRQSMPFGTLKGPHGLLFIAYSNSPAKFDLVRFDL
jgi:putative iron-dependent peroxidase